MLFLECISKIASGKSGGIVRVLAGGRMVGGVAGEGAELFGFWGGNCWGMFERLVEFDEKSKKEPASQDCSCKAGVLCLCVFLREGMQGSGWEIHQRHALAILRFLLDPGRQIMWHLLRLSERIPCIPETALYTTLDVRNTQDAYSHSMEQDFELHWSHTQ